MYMYIDEDHLKAWHQLTAFQYEDWGYPKPGQSTADRLSSCLLPSTSLLTLSPTYLLYYYVSIFALISSHLLPFATQCLNRLESH